MRFVKRLLPAGARLRLRHLQAWLLALVFEPGFPHPTRQVVLAADLGYTSSNENRYEPSGWLDLFRTLYRERITPADAFADIGCGRGRMVYFAARWYRFGRVVGMDYPDELVAQGRENMAAAAQRGRLKAPVEIVQGDARTWPLPDDVTHVYHANAVQGDIHRALLDHIAASYDRRPRRLLLHYSVPVEHDAVLATGRFEVVRLSRGIRGNVPKERIFSYRVVPATTRS